MLNLKSQHTSVHMLVTVIHSIMSITGQSHLGRLEVERRPRGGWIVLLSAIRNLERLVLAKLLFEGFAVATRQSSALAAAARAERAYGTVRAAPTHKQGGAKPGRRYGHDGFAVASSYCYDATWCRL